MWRTNEALQADALLADIADQLPSTARCWHRPRLLTGSGLVAVESVLKVAVRYHPWLGDGPLGGIDLAQSETAGTCGFAAPTRLFAAGAVVRVPCDTIILASPFIAEEHDLDDRSGKIDRVLAAP